MIPNQSVREDISKRCRGNLTMSKVLQSLDHFIGPQAGALTTVVLFAGVPRMHIMVTASSVCGVVLDLHGRQDTVISSEGNSRNTKIPHRFHWAPEKSLV